MGMAASRARLLTITARMHDVEYQAQSIQNAKIQLANQSDQVYQEYLEALDATTLTVKDQTGSRVPANFSNLCGPDAIKSASGKNYVFFDANNRLIVEDSLLAAYENFDGKDEFDFAMMMLGADPDILNGSENEDSDETLEERIAKESKNQSIQDLMEERDGIVTQIALMVNTSDEDEDKEHLHDDIENVFDTYSDIFEGDDALKFNKLKEQYEEKNDLIRQKLYMGSDRLELFEAAGGNKDEFDYSKFNFYVEQFVLMETNECVALSSFDGHADGCAAKSGEWLQMCLQNGSITISEVSMNNKNGEVTEKGTSVPSDSSLEYTTSSSIDKTALAKAEAEYEHKSKKIDQKDKQFDMDLNKLDTERNALKTEYESVKKVISDNIERTFGIFS